MEHKRNRKKQNKALSLVNEMGEKRKRVGGELCRESQETDVFCYYDVN